MCWTCSSCCLSNRDEWNVRFTKKSKQNVLWSREYDVLFYKARSVHLYLYTWFWLLTWMWGLRWRVDDNTFFCYGSYCPLPPNLVISIILSAWRLIPKSAENIYYTKYINVEVHFGSIRILENKKYKIWGTKNFNSSS